MANNFRLTGNVYVSKDGSDANSGLTPDLPKLTVQAGITATAVGQTLIIGAGVYAENFLSKAGSSGTLTIRADGEVILEGTQTVSFSCAFTSNSFTVSIYGVTIRNYLGIYSSITANFSSITTTINWYDCVIINTNLYTNHILIGTSNNTYQTFTRCKIIKTRLNYSGTTATGCYYHFVSSCLIDVVSIVSSSTVNPSTSGVIICRDNYVDSSSVLSMFNSITTTNFNYNNIQGRIIMNSGTYSGIALNYADHSTYYPTFNVNSMSVDPKFNNIQNLNFTLQSDSPHIQAASDYSSNIGGTEYAKYYNASDSVFSGGTITDLAYQGSGLLGAYTISAGTSGNIVTQPMEVQSYPATKPLTGIILEGDLEFNKSITAPAQGNQNVPAYDTYTVGAGANPDRLKIKMRYSTQSASPTAGQWDNGGYIAADAWMLVEVNMKPKVDSNGIGNGDYTYLEFSGLGDLLPTWIQLDIKLRNDYQI